MARWNEAKNNCQDKIIFMIHGTVECVQLCIWGVYLHCLQWLRNIWDVWDEKPISAVQLGALELRDVDWTSDCLFCPTGWQDCMDTLKQTHVNIATRVSSIIQLSVTLFICNSLTWQYFAFSLRPPLVSQHSSLPHSLSLSVSLVVLSIFTSPGSNSSLANKKKRRSSVWMHCMCVHLCMAGLFISIFFASSSR